MAVRIGQYVISGELRNTHRNSVFGWLEFAPDYGVRIELTGNFGSKLDGKHVRFRSARADANPSIQPEDLPDFVNDLADRQIGVVGEMSMRRAHVPDLPIDEFLDLSPEQKQAHLAERDCLYLEWFSQNGRVVAEIIDVNLEFVESSEDLDDSEGEDEEYESGYTEIHFDENGVPQSQDFDIEEDDEEDAEPDDPFGLFTSDLEKRVAEALGKLQEEDTEDGVVDEDESETPGKRPWDEVIPGLDAETKEMYERWDEIFEGKKDEPISYLFQKPLKLPKPEHVNSPEEAEGYVRAILAQLALLSVALDVCEHFSPLDTYRLLINEILPTAKVHPNLAASEMVQHYATSDYCDACEAEFDADYIDSLENSDEDSEDQQASDIRGEKDVEDSLEDPDVQEKRDQQGDADSDL